MTTFTEKTLPSRIGADDILLDMVFDDADLWQEAIAKGVDKDISFKDLQEMCNPAWCRQAKIAMANRDYLVFPPHAAAIPKTDDANDDNLRHLMNEVRHGRMTKEQFNEVIKDRWRIVYVNMPKDRVLFIAIYKVLARNNREMVSPICRSYQEGVSCGDTVKELAKNITNLSTQGDGVVGWKSDFTKYFDRVPLPLIEAVWQQLERKYGKSAIIDFLRNYYENDWYFDLFNDLCREYKSLKQGCAVAAWLANVVIKDVDDRMAARNPNFRRYCDDTMYIGADHEEALAYFKSMLDEKGIGMNPKKLEQVRADRWIKFLGFSIKGNDISLSSTAIEKLNTEIKAACLEPRQTKSGKWVYPTFDVALRRVTKIIYNPNGDYSWATRVLRTVNVDADIRTIDEFIKDCLRAAKTKHRKVGGIGFQINQKVGCVCRGRGRNVSSNLNKTEQHIDGWLSLIEMRNALRSGRAVYDALLQSRKIA